MKKRVAGAFFFLAFTVAAAAHEELPIYPVHVSITVDDGELNAVITMNGIYMNDSVLMDTYEGPLTATKWPAKAVDRARTYIQNCFSLTVDGHALAPSVFSPRFIQEPLDPENARFVFTLRYPLLKPGGLLSGHAAFFSEYKTAFDPGRKDVDPVHAEFITYLSVVGKETVRFELPVDKPDFALSLDGMARPLSSRLLERARRILFVVACSPFFWIALIFIIVQGIKRGKKRTSVT
jgi:hypothetical protein